MERYSKPSPPSSPKSSSEDTYFEPKKKSKNKSTNSSKKTTSTTIKVEIRAPPRLVAVCTLVKVDGGSVKLNKCAKAKDHDRKKRVEGAVEIRGSDTFGSQKGLSQRRKIKVGHDEIKEEVSKEKGEPRIKVIPNRNPFRVVDLVMSTAKQISYPAYDFHYISPSYLFFGLVKDIVLGADPADDKINVH